MENVLHKNPPSFDICTYEIRILLETVWGETNKQKKTKLGRAPEEHHTLSSQIFMCWQFHHKERKSQSGKKNPYNKKEDLSLALQL